MKKIIIPVLLFLFNASFICAQNSGVSLHSISNYNNWEWNSIVLKNEFITIAAVPAIGGRIMQYDLDSLPSIYINPNELGKTYTPKNRDYHNFGGYKNWPSPQYRWPGQWPPPATLDFGAYTFQADSTSNDSVSVTVTSPVEQWVAVGIQYQRKATIYPGTSHVKIDQTIINQGTSAVNWGLWSITQSIVFHKDTNDYQNFRAYFPLNPNSVYGPARTKTDGSSHAWKGEVVPGVYEVQFYAENKKIHADPNKGWIAYANISDSVVFVKTFEIFEGAHYPDSARITVYVSDKVSPYNPSPPYMEVEVKSPLADLAPNGGSYTFTENWWSAKMRAPVLDANSAGAIAGRLSYNSTSKILTGVYGIFHKGTARITFFDENNQLLSEGQQNIVSPLQEFKLQEAINIPAAAKIVKVQVYNENGNLIGTVDSSDIAKLESDVYINPSNKPSKFKLSHNYPNPFNPTTTLDVSVPSTSHVSLKVYDLLGRQVAELINRILAPGIYKTSFDGSALKSGVYFCCLEAGNFKSSHKLVLIK